LWLLKQEALLIFRRVEPETICHIQLKTKTKIIYQMENSAVVTLYFLNHTPKLYIKK